MNEEQFLKALQTKAVSQAKLNSSSPLPGWIRPAASVVGLHYWQVLLIVSCIMAIGLSVLTFPMLYSRVIGVSL